MVSHTVAELRRLPTIRKQCRKVHDLAKEGQLHYFEYHADNIPGVVDFCREIIERDFGRNYTKIPPHGRWRHLDFKKERISQLTSEWESSKVDRREICRRLLDLFLVSVLLDAGAGKSWQYKEPGTDEYFSRSEGLAVASFHMFQEGFFSGDKSQPYRVDAEGLKDITAQSVGNAVQVTAQNQMDGLEGRSSLLQKLADALKASPEFFGDEGRPGNMIDYLEKHTEVQNVAPEMPVSALWHVLIEGLQVIWPSRFQLNGISLGDVWPCEVLNDDYVPFHKLTQWTCYSLLEVIQKIMGWKVTGIENMTGLPEYRNGGLLVDLGVLTLREEVHAKATPEGSILPVFEPSHGAIVEWRAMTVICLDIIAEKLRETLGFKFELVQILESATWKGGREIAAVRRPDTRGPPIEIISDGTVF